MQQLPFPSLMVITDRSLFETTSDLLQRIRAALQGGANIVQLREKDLPTRDLLSLAHGLRIITKNCAIFLINGRPDVALACGADGVHLSETGISVQEARQIVGPAHLIGRSVHSIEEALESQDQGAHFLQVGTIFSTQSKPGKKPEGLEVLRRIVTRVSLPTIGVGGIDDTNVKSVLQTGAWGVAVIRGVLTMADPAKAAINLLEAMNSKSESRFLS